MEYNFSAVSHQYPVVLLFVRHLAYSRGIGDAISDSTNNKWFWESAQSAYLELALIAWCKVFGTDGEETHWKKVLAENIDEIEEQDLDEFRHRILSKTSLTKNQYDAYHQKMRGLRNTFVVHLDLSKPFNEPTPIFNTAFQVACAYEEWIKWLMTPVRWDNPAFISQYEQWKAKAFSVVMPLAKT